MARMERKFPANRASLEGVVAKHALDGREVLARAAYNAALADALWTMGEFSKPRTGTNPNFPIPTALIERICSLERTV